MKRIRIYDYVNYGAWNTGIRTVKTAILADVPDAELTDRQRSEIISQILTVHSGRTRHVYYEYIEIDADGVTVWGYGT